MENTQTENQKHTPEPWHLGEQTSYGTNILDSNGNIIPYDFDGGFDHVNAERIVQCVNALQGVENPSEWKVIQGERIQENIKLKAEIEELKEKLNLFYLEAK